MANALPKIINNDPETCAINTAADVTASTEFSMIHNGSSNEFSIAGTTAEQAPYGITGASTYTIDKAGNYTIFGAAISISENASNFYQISPTSGYVSIYLNKGNAVTITSGGFITGCRESFLDCTFMIPSSILIGGDRYLKADYLKIT